MHDENPIIQICPHCNRMQNHITLSVDRVNCESVLEQLQLVVLNMYYYSYSYLFIFLFRTHCDELIPEKTGQIITERERERERVKEKNPTRCLLYFQAKLL